MEDLFHYTCVKNGIKMHFLHSSVFDSQDSQEGSDKMKDIVFCSNNCFVLYSAAVQAKNSENKVSIKHWQTWVSWNYCSYLLENRKGPRGKLALHLRGLQINCSLFRHRDSEPAAWSKNHICRTLCLTDACQKSHHLWLPSQTLKMQSQKISHSTSLGIVNNHRQVFKGYILHLDLAYTVKNIIKQQVCKNNFICSV